MEEKTKSQFFVLVLLWLIFNPIYTFSQNSISGFAFDKDGHVISGVSVVLFNEGKVVAYQLSDSKGKYAINNIPSMHCVLRASCVGYSDIVDSVYVEGDKKYDIRMIDTTTELDSVVVTT